MKKLLTILCAMLLTVSAQAKDKVLDRSHFCMPITFRLR